MEEDKYLQLFDKIQEVREDFERIQNEEGSIFSINVDGVLYMMQEFLQRTRRKHLREQQQ